VIAGPGPPGPAPYKRRRPYDRLTNRPTGRFAIVDGPQIDDSQECDGASVTHEFFARVPERPSRGARRRQHTGCGPAQHQLQVCPLEV